MGHVRAERGQPGGGDAMLAAMDELRAACSWLATSITAPLTASALTREGRFDDARRALARGHEVEAMGERLGSALLELEEGKLAWATVRDECVTRERFERALAIARSSGAKPWQWRIERELRSWTSPEQSPA
jgi:hypothetical protein